MYPRLVSYSVCNEGDLELLILLPLPGAMNAGRASPCLVHVGAAGRLRASCTLDKHSYIKEENQKLYNIYKFSSAETLKIVKAVSKIYVVWFCAFCF